MTWTYSDALATNKDIVRFLVQDTDSTRPLLSDGEVIYSLTVETEVLLAAAFLCETLLGGV